MERYTVVLLLLYWCCHHGKHHACRTSRHSCPSPMLSIAEGTRPSPTTRATGRCTGRTYHHKRYGQMLFCQQLIDANFDASPSLRKRGIALPLRNSRRGQTTVACERAPFIAWRKLSCYTNTRGINTASPVGRVQGHFMA